MINVVTFYLLRVVDPVDRLPGYLHGLHLHGVQGCGETDIQAPDGIFTRESHLSCQLQPSDSLLVTVSSSASWRWSSLIVISYSDLLSPFSN